MRKLCRSRRFHIAQRQTFVPCRSVLVLALLFVHGITAPARADFDRLLRGVPHTANAIVVLNVEQVFSSPLAAKQQWKQRYSDAFSASPLLLPPSAQRFVMASEIDIEFMRPEWEIALLELSADPTAAEISSRIGGVEDMLAGKQCVWTPENALIIKMAPRQFAVLSPAQRQEAARWIRRTQKSQTVELTPYLSNAARYVDRVGTEIIMAIDLRDILRPQEIRAAIDRSTLLEGKQIDRGELAAVLADIQGITLGVRVGKTAYGKIKVDFNRDVGSLRSIAKPMLLRVLQGAGAMLEEFTQWRVASTDRQISIAGNISTDGMRRLFSLLTLNTSHIQKGSTSNPPVAENERQASTPGETTTSTMGRASRRYFNAMDTFLTSIHRSRMNESISNIALWMENYARRIDRLPARNVDPQLLEFGQSVAARLRQAVATVHGSERDAKKRQSEVQPDVQYSVSAVPWRRYNIGGFRTWSYAPFAHAHVDLGSAAAERREIRNEEYNRAVSTAQSILDQIEQDTKAIREELAGRYPMTF